MKRWILGASLACALIFAAPLRADTVSDWLTVFDAAGNVATCGTPPGPCTVSVLEAAEDNTEIYFINDASIVDPNQYGNAVVLVEADGSFSDIFGLASINGGPPVLAFNSDVEGAPPLYAIGGVPTFTYTPEGNGGTFDATMFLSTDLRNAGYTAQFFTDGDAVVPEPGTLVLLGSGLLGAIGSLRKRIG